MQPRQTRRPAVNGGQPSAQAFGKTAQIIGQDAMLARQRPDGKQPLLQRLQLGRVEIQTAQRLLNPAHRVAQFDQGPVQRPKCAVKPPLGPVRRALHPAQRVAHGAFGPVRQGAMGADDIGADPFRPLHQAAAGIQCRLLARFGVQLVQLHHGMAQIVFFHLRPFERALRRLKCRPRLGPCAPRRTHPGQIQPGKGIKKLAMPARVQKTPVIMLAVQFHQRIRQITQHLARDPAIVDPGRLAPVHRVDAAQDQLALLGHDPRLGQNRMGGMKRIQIKDRHNLALRGPCAHQIRPPPPAQHKAQGIQQDRLARPGFAGQHIQPRPKGQRQPIDDQHITNFKRTQHLGPVGAALRPSCLQPFALDHLTIDRGQPVAAFRLRHKALTFQETEAVLIKRAGLVIVTKDRGSGLRLISEAKRKIGLNQPVQRFCGVGCGLEILHHNLEPVDGSRIILALKVIAPDLHFLASQMIEGQIELHHRRLGIFAVRILLDHGAQRLQRLEGQALIAANLVNLIVIGQRHKILGIGCIFIAGIEVEIALRGDPRLFVFFGFMQHKGLHNQTALRPFSVGIKPLHFREIAQGIARLARGFQRQLTAFVNLFGRQFVKRDFFVSAQSPRTGPKRPGQKRHAHPPPHRCEEIACHLPNILCSPCATPLDQAEAQHSPILVAQKNPRRKTAFTTPMH